ncbi:MAG: hypothetical protein Q7P63_05620 [Verrucomicrobiota bacterium JB022]|nr:hypothetical protein [Verrucomicrobiota bacterium JB022]
MADQLDIVFLTAGAEPGKDGVGDYVRQVGGALAARGYAVGWLAWRDSGVSEPKGRIDHGIVQLRLSAASTELARRERAVEWWQSHRPTVLSWQLTPYGFHPRGWVGGLGNWFRHLAGPAKVQLMAHEIWLGAKRESTPRERIAGQGQWHSWRRMIRTLRPDWVHTQASPYQYLLKSLGVQAELLPLCGNIPLYPSPPRDDPHFRVGFFGSLYEPWDEKALFADLQRLSSHLNRPVKLMAAGRLGAAGEARWQRWQQERPHGWPLERCARHDPASISRYLQQLDLGLTTNPVALLEKSGSFIAMQEHGLRVRVLRDDVSFPRWRPARELSPHLCRPGEDIVRWWDASEPPPRVSRLPQAADAYQRLIEEARR